MSSDSVPSALAALSDRPRLRIAAMLLDGELCVGDLVSLLDAPQPTVSRHLAVLRASGLIVARKSAAWSFYSLARASSPFERALHQFLGSCVEADKDLHKDRQQAKKLARRGGCCPGVARRR
ncbi:MAG: winged helix-turn-helix transcriptional regulator [Deltaproteobacteria bacterium]|nr:winged helix-turn-helix transcriptional regulator [Deltaproteobacteria bacterium]